MLHRMTPLPMVSLLVIAAAVIAKADEIGRPNIVLIMADDMGYSDIGCMGGEIQTPNIDRLAEGGIRFTQFYNTGRCCPTRASLLTGLYPHQAGVGRMVYRDHGSGYRPFLNRNCATIAEALADGGYRTMMAGKWHVGHAKGHWPTDRGFEHFYGIHIHIDSYFKVLPGCPVFHQDRLVIPPTAKPENTLHPKQEWYTTDVFTDWSLRFLDEATDDRRPFFLYTAYNSPHWPLEAPDENIKHYRDAYLGGWDELRRTKLQRMKEIGLVGQQTELSPSGVPGWETLSPEDRRESMFRRAIYAAQIERMDKNIGRIVKKLVDLGKLENTLILFLSDNGCSAEAGIHGYKWKKNRQNNFADWRNQSGRSSSQGEAWSNASNAPFRLHKRWVHEGGISTPLIAHWPNVIQTRGTLCEQPGHVVDIMATCVDVANAQYPTQRDGNQIKPAAGISLLPWLKDPDKLKDRTLFWEHETHAAVRKGDWKLVTLNAKNDSAWELYDLSNERTETVDQSSSQPNRVTELRTLWTDWAKQSNVLPWPSDRTSKKQ